MRRPEIAATRGRSAAAQVAFTAAAALAIGCGGTTGRDGNPGAPSDASPSDAAMQDATAAADAFDLDASTVEESAAFDVTIVYADAARLPDVAVPPADGGDAGRVPLPTCGNVCDGNEGGVCTPTECLFYHQGPDCYNCLLQAGCLDDAPPPISFGDTGHECADLTAPGADGGPTDSVDPLGTPRRQRCLDVVQCTLANSSAQPILAFGYCGMQPTTVSCQTATPGQTGPCLAVEQAGVETVDPNTVLSRYTNITYGGGMANQLFQCAIANMCPACLSADAGHADAGQ
jgi:hypothetical protein